MHWSVAAAGRVLHLLERHRHRTGAPPGERETRRIYMEKKIKV
jgi:hypothetical protein